jgi:endonuclease/exonuclease/phosphatase (EEP) superfamily protein YafD
MSDQFKRTKQSKEASDENAESEPLSRRAKILSLAKKCFPIVCLSVWFLGTLLQLLIRDHFSFLAPVFYALPWPVVVWFGLTGCVFFRPQLARLRWGLLVVVLVQLGFWLHGSLSMTQPEVTKTRPVRFMFWNVCRGLMGYENVAKEINASDAHLVAMVEVTHQAQDVRFWQKHCPGYQAYRLGSGMIVLVNGQVLDWDHGSVSGVTRYRILDLEVDKFQFTLMLMDVKADPFVVRRPAMERMKEIAIEHRDQPFLVAGDFNTPPESVYFDDVRSELSKAFEVCGEGYRETWPVILPILDLDQVWGNRNINWHRCWRGWSIRSDHRPVFVEFSDGSSS